MSLFNFEEVFSEAVKNAKVHGYKEFYKSPLTEEIVCYVNENNDIFDLNNNIIENQSRYREMIESSALLKVNRLDISKPLLSEIGFI